MEFSEVKVGMKVRVLVSGADFSNFDKGHVDLVEKICENRIYLKAGCYVLPENLESAEASSLEYRILSDEEAVESHSTETVKHDLNREGLAAAAMQGIIVAGMYPRYDYETVAKESVKYADALIAELRK